MHLLIIHPELAIGGAEKMLGYFLPAVSARIPRVTVAVAGGQLKECVPISAETLIIPDSGKLSVWRLIRQISQLNRSHRQEPFDVVHGWTARDWELASLVARIWGRPALGTLHDHPAADYIRRRRRRLMRWAAVWGLQRVVCVSHAVRKACETANYPKNLLVSIHNGLPGLELAMNRPVPKAEIQLGYIGALTPAKGIEDLLEIMDRVSARTAVDWRLQVAGAPVRKRDETWLAQLKERYAQRPWWPRVAWLGWIDRPANFLGSIDLLAFTACAFDSLPTVLLEAAWMGTPVLASAVGGAPEIVEHGLTGWLFAPGNRSEASTILLEILKQRALLSQAGIAARQRAAAKFSIQNMVDAYENIYITLQGNYQARR